MQIKVMSIQKFRFERICKGTKSLGILVTLTVLAPRLCATRPYRLYQALQLHVVGFQLFSHIVHLHSPNYVAASQMEKNALQEFHIKLMYASMLHCSKCVLCLMTVIRSRQYNGNTRMAQNAGSADQPKLAC